MRDDTPPVVQLLRIAAALTGAGLALGAWLATVAAGVWLDVTLPGGLRLWGPVVVAALAGTYLVRHRASVVPAARRAWADRPSWSGWRGRAAALAARSALLAARIPTLVPTLVPTLRRVRS